MENKDFQEGNNIKNSETLNDSRTDSEASKPKIVEKSEKNIDEKIKSDINSKIKDNNSKG